MRNGKDLEQLFTTLKDPAAIWTSEIYSKWTIPSVFTRDLQGLQGKRAALHHDYQSQMAILINSAATKVVNALFPQGAPFFRLVDSEDMRGVADELGITGSLQSIQAQLELEASAQVFQKDGYAAKLRAAKLLMITGNALEYYDAERKKSHIYSIRDYAVKRDGFGEVMCIVLKERISVMDLPDDFRASHFAQKEGYEDLCLYTGVQRESVWTQGVQSYRYKVTQQVEQFAYGEPSYYPLNQLPYIVLTWELVTGEHYGRGLVESYAGDIARLSELTKALTLYEVEAMRFVNVSSSASGIDIDQFAESQTGEIIQTSVPAGANPGVWAYEGGEYNKIQVMQSEINALEQKLARAFMYTGAARDSERTTAYELRQNAQEAQNALGDAYSNLSDSWLTKLAYLYCTALYPQLRPLLDLDVVKLEVTVGTASLNKAAQAERLIEASQALQLVAPVLQQLTKRTNIDALVDSIMDSYGVQTSKFFYSDRQMQEMLKNEEAAQAQAVQQQEQVMAAADPTVAAQQLGLIQ